MKKIAKCESLVSKVASLYEVNINFNVYNDNIFLTKLKDKAAIDSEASQIVSLCSVMLERPNIQY